MDGLHVAIIMDGNGRWAARRGRPRTAGHLMGIEAVRRVVKAAPGLGVRTLTLYAFSSDNWKRPPAEVSTLFRLLDRHLSKEAAQLRSEGVELRVIGRRDRLPRHLLDAVEAAEARTRGGSRLNLRLAVDYSARDSIVRAARAAARMGTADLDRTTFAEELGRALGENAPASDVDLLIRTGGECRLSDFLLWECSYAELFFTDVMWPDFQAEDLAKALKEFGGRHRRFGRVPDQAAG